jgi:hypothetical protein
MYCWRDGFIGCVAISVSKLRESSTYFLKNKSVLYEICVRTLRLRNKISATPSGWNYFVGRFPRVVRSSQPQAIFRSAFSAFEFAAIREIRVKVFCFRFDTSP